MAPRPSQPTGRKMAEILDTRVSLATLNQGLPTDQICWLFLAIYSKGACFLSGSHRQFIGYHKFDQVGIKF
jgi:hypothetical protein